MKNLGSKGWLFIIIILMVITGATLIFFRNQDDDEALYLALVAPLSGEDATFGAQMRYGAQLYLDEINAAGGIDGKPVKLLIVSSNRSQPEALEEKVQTLINKPALLVMGHYLSVLATGVGKIYEENEIPALSSAASSPQVVQGNDWFFRVSPGNDLYADFSASYMRRIEDFQEVSIIYDDESNYSVSMANKFEDQFQRLGGEIKRKWVVPNQADDISPMIAQIIKDLEQSKAEGREEAIFMVNRESNAHKIILALKRNGLDPPIFAATMVTLGERFRRYPEEQEKPGYFSDGVQVINSFLFDEVGEQAQKFRDKFVATYHLEPTEVAVMTYDTTMVAVQALRETGVQGDLQNLAQERRTIRDYLAGLTSSTQSIEGIAGPIYFDDQGDAIRQVVIGRYQNQQLLSSFTQLRPVKYPQEVVDLDGELASQRILKFGDRLMYKTSLVQTGLKLNEIKGVSSDGATYDLDFFLWFRFKDQIDPADIKFLNAVEPIELGDPLEQKEVEGITYRLYRVQGKFRTTSLQRFPLGQHTLNMSFRHRTLSQNNLVYVTDRLGMGLDRETSLTEKLRQEQVLDPTLNWDIHNVAFFQNFILEDALGDPSWLTASEELIAFSRFNASVEIRERQLTVSHLIPSEIVQLLLIVSLFMTLVLFISTLSKRTRIPRSITWVLQLVFLLLLLFSGEGLLVDWLVDRINQSALNLIILAFDILWWLIPTILLVSAVSLFVWAPLEEKIDRTIPAVVRNFVAFLIYLLAFFGIVAFVFDRPVTSLLATSGLVATIIGLAIQIDISNVFSGIAINVERPFRPGDWIKISGKEGKVLDITWRTTRMQTRMGNMVIIPNSDASRSVVENFNYPNDKYWAGFTVEVGVEHPPEWVEKILTDAVVAVKDVLEPWVIFSKVEAGLANYGVYFLIRDYGKLSSYKQQVWKQVWIHLQQAGITYARPLQDSYNLESLPSLSANRIDDLRSTALLDEIELFHPFTQDEKDQLAQEMMSHHYAAGETIFHQGEESDSLFIVAEGVVSVWAQFENETVEVGRLGVGKVFGEMALVSNQPRNSTVVAKTETHLFEIDKADIVPFFKDRPEIMDHLSKILARRKTIDETQREMQQFKQVTQDRSQSQILRTIQNIFKLDNK